MFRTTPPQVAGTVGAIFNSALQVGSAVGNAIISSIQTSVEAQPSSGGTDGYDGRAAAFWFMFAITILETTAVAVFYRPGRLENVAETDISENNKSLECTRCNTMVDVAAGITDVKETA